MEIKTYTLTNDRGIAITVTNYGCAIINLKVPDKHGKLCDIVLGLDSAADYATKPHPFFGVVAGRYANRIGQGTFTLEGKTYQLAKNNGDHHLHGGLEGFDKKIWTVEEATDTRIVFTYHSPDGEENYPGNLLAKITYTLKKKTLRIDYHATTDTETICNLTNHSYFNLNGYQSPNIYNHKLEINADYTTAVDADLIPTGELASVTDTPFDFRKAKTIGADMEAAGKVNNTGGYDHNYVLRSQFAAKLFSPETGIIMYVCTDSPGMQLYTGNMIPEGVTGKGVTYGVHSGLCLETQLFPDAINKPHFPSPIVKKGEAQTFYTEFEFTRI